MPRKTSLKSSPARFDVISAKLRSNSQKGQGRSTVQPLRMPVAASARRPASVRAKSVAGRSLAPTTRELARWMLSLMSMGVGFLPGASTSLAATACTRSFVFESQPLVVMGSSTAQASHHAPDATSSAFFRSRGSSATWAARA